jgi:hypothetical protein
VAFTAPFFVGSSNPGSLTDANGNVISYSGGTFTDTLATTALTIAGLPPTTTYTYTGPGGASTVTVKYTQKTVQTNFGCSGISEYGPNSIYLVSEIDLPDQGSVSTDKYTINYETTYNYPNSVTGPPPSRCPRVVRSATFMPLHRGPTPSTVTTAVRP